MTLDHVARRPSLTAEVAAQLRGNIVNGTWPVGTRIPAEPELAAQLGVARNTLREAIRSLVHTGLLVTRQGSGTYVLATSELSALMRARFSDAELQDVNDFRAALEAMAAQLAAGRRGTTDLRRIEAALARREKAWTHGDADAFADADATFHLTVAAATHNTLVQELYADLYPVIRDRIAGELGAEVAPDKYVDHSALVDAIRDQDATRAAAEAAGHAHSWSTRTMGARPPGGTRREPR